jgi:hypothetical protein
MFHVEHLKQKTKMDKKTIKSKCFNTIALLLVAVIVYVCFALQSCSMYKQTDINGKTTIVTTDTTYINHNTLLKYPKK